MTGYKILEAEKLRQIAQGKGIIIDVRSHMEHAEKHLTCAHHHVPLDELNPAAFIAEHGINKDSDIYIVCHSGKRAANAAEKFIAYGCGNIHVVEGGIVACEGCGHSVAGRLCQPEKVKIKGPISLERQVRIAAGMFVATGALLALLFNPLFGVIPLFVGCGLIYAGVTDRCGLALILTKAPWNKISPLQNK